MGFLKELTARKALAAHGRGNHEEAYGLYQEAYRKGAMDKASYLLPYSILLMRRGEYELAGEVLKKAEKAPGGLTQKQRNQMLTNYAVVSWKQGRIDYAVGLMQEVFRKGPSGTVYGTLGYLLIEKGDVEEALAFNKEAVEYDEEDAICLDNLAQTYYRLAGDEAAARPLFEKALKEKPDAIDTNYFLALYDIKAGKKEAAREKLEVARKGKASPLNFATKERIEALLTELGQGEHVGEGM